MRKSSSSPIKKNCFLRHELKMAVSHIQAPAFNSKVCPTPSKAAAMVPAAGFLFCPKPDLPVCNPGSDWQLTDSMCTVSCLQELSLPQSVFLFCLFNNQQKITSMFKLHTGFITQNESFSTGKLYKNH